MTIPSETRLDKASFDSKPAMCKVSNGQSIFRIGNTLLINQLIPSTFGNQPKLPIKQI